MKHAGLSQILLTERYHLPIPGQQDSGASQSLVTMCSTNDTHTREASVGYITYSCMSVRMFQLKKTGRILIQSYVHVTSLSF